MFKTVFELQSLSSVGWHYYITILGLSFLISYAFYERYFAKKGSFSKMSLLRFYFFITVFLSFLIMTAFGFADDIRFKSSANEFLNNQVGAYKGQDFEVASVEGYVENFVHGKDFGRESFEIGGVRMVIPKHARYGYDVHYKNGGVIGPGKYLRISFISPSVVHGRIIYKIEEDIEKTKLYEEFKKAKKK